MPELPEVETFVRLLRPELEGRRIERASVAWERTVGGNAPAFARAVRGADVARVWRRGKYLVLDLERRGELAGWLVGHLRMTGRLFVERRNLRSVAHLRLRLDLSGDRALYFVDPRKFGRIVHTEDLEAAFPALGPEPLEPEFTPEWLAAALRDRRRRLKPLLLDQSFVAGLGNIYADEVLHESGLHPLRSSHSVPPAAAERLHRAILDTLRAAIAREGSSFDAFYRTPEGNPGGYQDEFRVYGRGGEPCRTCGTPITRLVLAQRGTHVCPRCQPRPRPRR
jgi:formamidopyrimidine-DNA glycosylase